MKKEIVTSRKLKPPIPGFPVAVRAGHLLFVSGRAGLDHETGMPLAGYRELGRRPTPALGLLAPDSWEETFVAQSVRIYEDLATLVAEQGAQLSDLLFYSIYQREMRNFPVLARTRAALFEGGVAPPSTASQVPALAHPGALVYFDPVAAVPDAATGSEKQVLRSEHVVPGPLSNYQLASRAGDFGFYAGVVGAHPESGIIVYGEDELSDADWPRPAGGLASRLQLSPVSAQSYTIYRLIRDMLAEHGTDLSHVVRFNIYLRNMRDLPEVERIGAHFMREAAPAGTAIGVESLARRDFHVEIECVTYCGGPLQYAPPDERVASWGLHASAVRGGDLVFVSALAGYDLAHGRMVLGPRDLAPASASCVAPAIAGLEAQTPGQIAAAVQTQVALDQLALVLHSLDTDLRSLVKLTVYVRDIGELPFVRNVLLARLGEDPPAITAIAVADLPLPDARVQFEAIAL